MFANLVGHLASSIQTISNSIRTKIHKTRTTLDTIASTCSLNVHTFQFNRDHKSLASFLLCRKDNTRKSLFENLKVEHQTKDLKVSQSSHLTINDCLKQQLFFALSHRTNLHLFTDQFDESNIAFTIDYKRTKTWDSS